MKPSATLSSWRAISIVVAVAGLLATGASSNASRPGPADSLAASFACNQPFPSAGPGRVTLSGVGYGPYHAGQDPN
jgi:hypothetical protein